MHIKRHYITILLLISTIVNTQGQKSQPTLNEAVYSYDHPIVHSPSEYICPYIDHAIKIDGVISESEWADVLWTQDFVDIQGELKNPPTLLTRAKMAWDNKYFYVAAKLYEPHIWATLTQRDDIMYLDDDFEIFIDPDGDGHNYFEFEMNAHNAIWDLLMLYPYRIDKARNYVMNYNIESIQSAVHIEGSLNQPSDNDQYWSVEVAIPWDTFRDLVSNGHVPTPGSQWRVNFSRVDWTMEIKDGMYRKVKKNGQPLPESNWVWSPTGYINMHKPETWGYVQFEKDIPTKFEYDPDEKIKWAMWQLYYQSTTCFQELNTNCTLDLLTIPIIQIPDYSFEPTLEMSRYGFDLIAQGVNHDTYVIDERARLKKIPPKKINRHEKK